MDLDAKITVDLITATKAVMERDLRIGLVTEAELRHVFMAGDRKKIAAQLAAEGVSNRKIAKLLGVNHSTIDRDLNGANAPKSAANAPLDTDKSAEISIDERKADHAALDDQVIDYEDNDDPDALTLENQWYNSFRHHAGESIAMVAYWRRQFGDFSKFQITSELVTLAKQALGEWEQLVKTLGENNVKT